MKFWAVMNKHFMSIDDLRLASMMSGSGINISGIISVDNCAFSSSESWASLIICRHTRKLCGLVSLRSQPDALASQLKSNSHPLQILLTIWRGNVVLVVVRPPGFLALRVFLTGLTLLRSVTVCCALYISMPSLNGFSEYNAGDMCQKVTSLTEHSSSSMLKLKLQVSNGVTGACITHHENKVSHTSPAC